MLIKKWNNNLFPESSLRLNSYALTLMVIAYLQDIKVLPNLQDMAWQQSFSKFDILKG
jgi:hypothetical protein